MIGNILVILEKPFSDVSGKHIDIWPTSVMVCLTIGSRIVLVMIGAFSWVTLFCLQKNSRWFSIENL
jgi:hypothetical protein